MKIALHLLIAIFIWCLATFSQCSDPRPLEDFCVAVNDTTPSMFVNGRICKDPKMVTADDFYFSGLNKPGNTSNRVGYKGTPVSAYQIPGLNTLGISFARIDYALRGLNPPHTHPRGTEILLLVEGNLHVGFVASISAGNPEGQNYRFFTKILHPGDVFVSPQGLIHFQLNIGKTNAVAFAGISSQSPGVIRIPSAVFGSNPPINPYVLEKAFQLDNYMIDYLLTRIWTDK